VLDQIKAENFERASELLDAVNQAIVASPLGVNGDRPAAESITTRDLRGASPDRPTAPMKFGSRRNLSARWKTMMLSLS
jgi:hypothetical protein